MEKSLNEEGIQSGLRLLDPTEHPSKPDKLS